LPLPQRSSGGQAGVPGDSLQHAGPDLLGIVEGKHEIGPALLAKYPVRAASITLESTIRFGAEQPKMRRAFVEGQRVMPRRT
jgi:hypothetical protein